MAQSVFIVLLISAFVATVTSDDISQGGPGTNFEASSGYSVSSQMDTSGKPQGSLYGFVGGKMTQLPGPQPTYYQQTEVSQGSSTAMWISQLTSAAYFFSGVVAAGSIWYLCTLAIGSKSTADLEDASSKKDTAKVAGKETEADKEAAKSRKRRETRKSDEEMTRLATIVLSAVQSGDCLQKSICLMGNQMYSMSTDSLSKKNSKKTIEIADNLLSTLLPPSIQKSNYYNVLRKSLRGEISCDQYKCMDEQ